MLLLGCLLVSVLCASGMAIVLVEKRFDWPVRNINVILRWHLRTLVHRKMQRALECSVCTAFWTTIITDAALLLLSHGHYWLWPLSGFATSGFVWFIYQLLKAIESIMPEIMLPHKLRDAIPAPVAPKTTTKACDDCSRSERREAILKNIKENGISSQTLPYEGEIDLDREVEQMRQEQARLNQTLIVRRLTDEDWDKLWDKVHEEAKDAKIE